MALITWIRRYGILDQWKISRKSGKKNKNKNKSIRNLRNEPKNYRRKGITNSWKESRSKLDSSPSLILIEWSGCMIGEIRFNSKKPTRSTWQGRKKPILMPENNSNMSSNNKSPIKHAKTFLFSTRILYSKYRRDKRKEEMLSWTILYKWKKLSRKSKLTICHHNPKRAANNEKNLRSTKRIKKARRKKNKKRKKNVPENRKAAVHRVLQVHQVHLLEVHPQTLKDKEVVIRKDKKNTNKAMTVAQLTENLTSNRNFTKSTWNRGTAVCWRSNKTEVLKSTMESTEKSTRRSINSTRNKANVNLKSLGTTQTCWGNSENRTENKTITTINRNRISSRTFSKGSITSDRRCIRQWRRTGTWNNIRVKNMSRTAESKCLAWWF